MQVKVIVQTKKITDLTEKEVDELCRRFSNCTKCKLKLELGVCLRKIWKYRNLKVNMELGRYDK